MSNAKIEELFRRISNRRWNTIQDGQETVNRMSYDPKVKSKVFTKKTTHKVPKETQSTARQFLKQKACQKHKTNMRRLQNSIYTK